MSRTNESPSTLLLWMESAGLWIRHRIHYILVWQTLIIVLWVILNSTELFWHPFDPYPFILLNLTLSLQAAFSGPLLLLSAEIDARDQHQTVLDIKAINQKQTQILEALLPLVQCEEQGIEKIEAEVTELENEVTPVDHDTMGRRDG